MYDGSLNGYEHKAENKAAEPPYKYYSVEEYVNHAIEDTLENTPQAQQFYENNKEAIKKELRKAKAVDTIRTLLDRYNDLSKRIKFSEAGIALYDKIKALVEEFDYDLMYTRGGTLTLIDKDGKKVIRKGEKRSQEVIEAEKDAEGKITETGFKQLAKELATSYTELAKSAGKEFAQVS